MADRAGVSRSAVSLVMNGRADGMISLEKQAAIRRAARELNYVPNSIALSLRTSRTSTIGVLADSIDTSPVIADTLLGAGSRAVQDGYLLLIVGLGATDGDEERAWEILHTRQLDALIFVAADLQRRPSPDVLRRVPSAMANCLDADGVVPGLVADEAGSVELLTDHLIAAGHRDIALITGRPDGRAAQERVSGYERALRRAGLEPRRSVAGGSSVADGHAAGTALLTSERAPSAVVAAGDRSAIGVRLAAADLGLSVPRDLSLVTIEEDLVTLDGMLPPLTAVRQPYVRIGAAVVDLVLDQIRRPGAEPQVARDPVQGDLIVRASVAPPQAVQPSSR